jgi:hypothetical protein
MEREHLKALEALLDSASRHLADVSTKRLFGYHALYRADAVFALVWKSGRIGMKIADPKRHQELMAIAGAEPWIAHAVMTQWALGPEHFHENVRLKSKWLMTAHCLATEKTSLSRGVQDKWTDRHPRRGRRERRSLFAEQYGDTFMTYTH